jgi:catechol 2,3-dioxygenase-like lactoylglutathione lyase family enzyme
MHRSRLSTVVIDCAEADFERSVEFWSRALGKRPIPEEDPRYVSLRGRVGGEGGPYVLLQRVVKEERAVHLDIETDDVEREVARLAGLGARVKARIRNHVVMLAPSGHAFCVVPSGRRGDFPGDAAEWK